MLKKGETRMTNRIKKILSFIIVASMIIACFLAVSIGISAAEGITRAQGWFESAYVEWSSVSGADGYNVYVAPAGSTSWTKLDSELVRKTSGGYRADAVGLKAGDYQLKVVPTISGAEQSAKAITTETVTVMAHDRSGYAHFNYTEGVGAYNDDGTLKKNAIVLYVTDENKDSVSVSSKDGTTVVGIGNILNSVGQDVGGGKNSKGGKANTNQDIIRKLAKDGTPLVIRIIGNVTAPLGLTQYDGVDFGGSVGDNGFMARMSGGKDITIEGIGSDATINGWGLHFICQTADYSQGFGRSFEVRNITFKNVPEDCVGMEGQQEGSTLTAPVERCWIHNCSFLAPIIANPAESDKDGGDGACDFKRGNYFTNSYCYYDGYHKTNLVGSSDSSLQYNITYHHNYWKNCESRGPLARQANIHMYNNVFEGQTSYCMSLRADSYIFSEYNAFIKCKNVVDDKTGGVCKSYNNAFLSSSFGSGNIHIVDNKTQTVSSGNKYANFDTNSSLSYIPSGNYIIQESISEMKAVVMAYAGVQKSNIVAPDSSSASVIPANRYPTSAVVLDYSKSLNKSYVTTLSGSFDNIVFNIAKSDNSSLTVGGNANGFDIVFYVDTEVNISMTEISGSYSPVLYNSDGVEIIKGNGSASKLPAGYYFIQSSGYDVGSAKFKEAKISSLTITAVDPNAAPNPIPTPPPVIPDNPGTDNPDNPGTDNPGTDNPGGNGGATLPAGSYTHNFTENGKVDPSGFFTISGNLSTSKGSVSYNGLTLTQCLKIESSTVISFNAPEGGTLVLVFGGNTSAAGKQIKIDGSPVDIGSDSIATVTVTAGAHQITKDDSIFLFFMAYYSDNQQTHAHNYVKDGVEPTCTEAGLLTYTCQCGDSYTETVEPLGHKFRDGACLGCGIDDPDYNQGGDDPIDPDNPGTDDPTDPDNPGTDDPTDPDNPGTDDPTDPETPESPEKPKTFWDFIDDFFRAIADFFARLFGIKKD